MKLKTYDKPPVIEPCIGESFQIGNSDVFKCIEAVGLEDGDECDNCSVQRQVGCFILACMPEERKDGKAVYFSKVNGENTELCPHCDEEIKDIPDVACINCYECGEKLAICSICDMQNCKTCVNGSNNSGVKSKKCNG